VRFSKVWWGERGMAWQARLIFGEGGLSGWGVLGQVSVGCGTVRQASLGELGYVLYCVEVSRGISR
jgi:hypothetical protein